MPAADEHIPSPGASGSEITAASGEEWSAVTPTEGGRGHVSGRVFRTAKPLAAYSIRGPHHCRVAVLSPLDFQCHEMAFIREGVSCSLTCSTVEWAAVGSLSFLPGVLDRISAEPLWPWEVNSQTREVL